jgi:predicted ATPase/class 3 adenylate cyclase
MPIIPTGTVTFLFTDIEGSTGRWEGQREAMQSALILHDEVLRSAIESHGGYVFKTVGDAFCASFPTATDALAAALVAQRTLHSTDWGDLGQLRVRMSLHTGVTEERDSDYFGPPVNRVARILSAGHGSQVLLSASTQELVRDQLPPGTELRDLGEHRLKDLLRAENIYQLVTADLPADFPPLKTLDSRPNNLPRQITDFVGREREVADLNTLLSRPRLGLLTLTGPGGTGKTRLALQVAADLVDAFDDGVWFVELAPLNDPTLVPFEIAQALGVKEEAGQPVLSSIKAHLRDLHTLLVLDNFEQVMEAASMIYDLIKAAPHLKVLVTSRTTLRIYGEQEYAVQPLSLPDPKLHSAHIPPPDHLLQYEAIRLFVDRARDVRADFELIPDNSSAVAQICARLDGLPLAIELAAARTRLFSPQALLPRLDSRLKLLTGGARNLPQRQQTLRGAIEWSHDLLDEPERQLFARMAVFQGGRTLDALEAVCNARDDLLVDVLTGVEALVTQSLVQQRDGTDMEPRFWMLETIHEFAREKLDDRGEGEDLRKYHLEYFLSLAEQTGLKLQGP